MEDPELEAIRQRKMAGMQSSQQQMMAQQQMAVALGRCDGSGIIIAGLWETNVL